MPVRPPHFETFQKQPNLLFQLILSEFLASFERIFTLRDLHKKLQNMPLDGCSQKKLNQTIRALQSHAVDLCGKTEVINPFHCWNFSIGSLTQLKHHCCLFSKCQSQAPAEFVLLHNRANWAWLSCLQAHDLGKILLQIPQETIWDSEEYASLMRNMERLVTQMGRFSRLVTRLFSHFKEDENVLYFLVRHHEQFNTIYGDHYVSKLLGKLFSQGHKEAEKLLLRRYKRRGFESHLDTIKHHFTLLA